MAIKAHCPSEDCPTLGVDANQLGRYADVDTGDGEWLIYDQDAEQAWIQSDLYYSRSGCI